MNMITLVVVVLFAFVGAWAAWGCSRAVRIVRRLRGLRVVTCPETGRPAGVTIDVAHAVTSGLIEHAPKVRVKSCSRWAERGRCDERCIKEAEEPTNTTRAIVERMLTGTPCAFCRRPIVQTAFLDHYAALLQPDGTTVEWPAVAPERLRGALSTDPPVCWDCHIAETFRRLYPELVTDRPSRHA
jgi:hypothetical protein